MTSDSEPTDEEETSGDAPEEGSSRRAAPSPAAAPKARATSKRRGRAAPKAEASHAKDRTSSDDDDDDDDGANAEPSARTEDRKPRDKTPLRAHFLDDFPSDPKLDALVRAFEAGNYALVRADAPKLARDAEDPRVRRAAAELRRRIDPAPLGLVLIGIAFLLLLILSYHYIGHPHAAAQPQ